VCLRTDPAAFHAYLRSLWAFLSSLGPSFNPLRAPVAYHRLALERAQAAVAAADEAVSSGGGAESATVAPLRPEAAARQKALLMDVLKVQLLQHSMRVVYNVKLNADPS
jgi:hypothetical protein